MSEHGDREEDFMRINHNIAAQVANANLKRVDNRVAASLQRLSSGYKINKAADDSAGLTISNKMRAQLRALEQSSRNADDGVSLLRTADGALSEIENMLQRCRELSVQSANDTLVIGDREAIQKEIDQLMEEIDRIAETTDFNGKKLFSGDCSRVVTCKTLGVDMLGVSDAVEAGDYSFTVNSTGTKAAGTLQFNLAAGGEVSINGTSIEITENMTEAQLYAEVVKVCDMMDIDVQHSGNVDTTTGTKKCSFTLTSRANGSDQKIIFQGNEATKETVATGTDADITLDASSKFTGKEGITANGGTVTIYDRTGFEMSFALEDAVSGSVSFHVYDTGALKLQVGTKEDEELSINFSKLSCETLKLREADGDSFVNVCSNFGASNAISLFDNAIQAVSAYRTKLGACENRLDSTVSALDVNVESTTASMSRIMDTDMAAEMTEYTQQNVLSQAATSILAQANNRPQQVMSLLQS